MPRPCKKRYIATQPIAQVFQPINATEATERILLTTDELEAIRLADLLGYDQGESAVAMNISRQTFGRILERAHQKIADALVNGKIIEIGGGVVVRTRRKHVHCRRCRHEWAVPQKEIDSFQCPRCTTK